MKGEILITETKDKLILHAFYCQPKTSHIEKIGVIHVHGSYGNFYENFFLRELAKMYTDLGISFLSISTRGRDYFADFKIRKDNQYDSKRIGGIREVFQECEFDIGAWIDFYHKVGINKVILQGHSLGAMKVVYYLARNPEVAFGLVLISPPDNYGLQKADVGSRLTDDLEKAKKLIKLDENTLMPEEAYYEIITAKTYLSILGKPNDTGMFTYSDVNLMKRAGMTTIRCPILATFATENEAIVNPINECTEALQFAISQGVDLECQIIDGANHSYHFKEKELSNTIGTWLKNKMLKL